MATSSFNPPSSDSLLITGFQQHGVFATGIKFRGQDQKDTSTEEDKWQQLIGETQSRLSLKTPKPTPTEDFYSFEAVVEENLDEKGEAQEDMSTPLTDKVEQEEEEVKVKAPSSNDREKPKEKKKKKKKEKDEKEGKKKKKKEKDEKEGKKKKKKKKEPDEQEKLDASVQQEREKEEKLEREEKERLEREEKEMKPRMNKTVMQKFKVLIW